MSEKRLSGGPILSSCAILAEFETIPINHPAFSGTTEMEGKGLSVCHNF